MRLNETLRITRRRLPHWEVEGGRYFVTVRCADSLPADVLARLSELHRDVSGIEPRSAMFATAQRQLFRTLEKHLDAGFGSCPLAQRRAAAIVVEEFHSLADWQIAVPHYSVMPNHWHALLIPEDATAHSLSAIMKRLKGRTAHRIRQTVPGRGAFWQTEWFDRWVRNDPEWDRLVTYIRNNPVKAGLAASWQQHGFTQ